MTGLYHSQQHDPRLSSKPKGFPKHCLKPRGLQQGFVIVRKGIFRPERV